MLAATLRRQIARGVFLVLIALTLLATPLRSSFHVRAGFVCEIVAPLERWVAGVLNWGHIIAYGVLVLVGNFSFREQPLAKAGAVTLALSVVVELEEAVFTVGHCRIRDLLPNLLAVVVSGLVCWAISHGKRPSFRRAK